MAQIATLLYGASAAFYTLAAIAHLFYLFRQEFVEVARWSTRIAWLSQSAGLALMIIETQRVPIHTLFEFAFFFTWVMMTNYIGVEVFRKDQTAGAFLLPVIAVVLILCVDLPKPGPEMIVQNHSASLIVWHVVVSLLGYAFFTASFVAGSLYLLQEYLLRRKRWGPLYHRMPSLEALDIWGGRFIYIGFPLLTLGMFSGLFFAQVTWETFWQSDAKVIFTVFVWLVYCGYLLMRKIGGWGGRRAAWWAVAGLAGLLINYFVMNLFSKLHRFGV